VGGKQKVIAGVVALAALGGGFSLWPRYGGSVVQVIQVVKNQSCNANDGSGNAVARMAQGVCGQIGTATPEWVEMPGVATLAPGQKPIPTATRVLPTPTAVVRAPATATPKVAIKRVVRGTPLPSATPLAPTQTPGPPPPTATMRSSAGAGMLGTQKTPCRLVNDPNSGLQADCKTNGEETSP